MITLDRKEFNSKLTKIQGLISKSSIASSALFEINGDSSIKATNLITGLKQKINISSDISAKFCMDKKICEVVKEIDGESLTLTIEGNNLLLTAGKSKFKIPCHPTENFNWWPAIEGERIKIDANDMADCLKKTVLFVARSQHDIKNCVLLEFGADNIRFVATDGHRLAVIDRKIAGGTKKARYALPESSVQEMINFLSKTKEVDVVLGEECLLLKTDEDELTIRPLEDKAYPAYANALNNNSYEGHSKMFADKSELTKAIRRVAVIDNRKTVRFIVKESSLAISSSSDMGEASDEVEVLYTPHDGNEEFEICFNAEYALDILKAASSDDPVFYFSSKNKPAYIEGGEGELYIVMPIMTSKEG